MYKSPEESMSNSSETDKIVGYLDLRNANYPSHQAVVQIFATRAN